MSIESNSWIKHFHIFTIRSTLLFSTDESIMMNLHILYLYGQIIAISYGYYSGHNRRCKGVIAMIRFAPLWKTMAERKVTTYTLRVKHGMSHATVQRLQADMPVSTHTLNKLCRILDCKLEDVAEYIPDEE